MKADEIRDLLPLVHTPGGFYKWLVQQVNHENGNIREVACDLPYDEEAKLYADHDEQFRQHLNRKHDYRIINLCHIAYMRTMERKEIKFVEDQSDFLLDVLVSKIDLADCGNADYVECCYRGRLKYETETDRWFLADDNGRWHVDTTNEVQQLIEQAMRSKLVATARLIDVKEKARHQHALRSCDAVKVSQCAKTLSARRKIAVKIGVFDADPWMLGTENAVLDLRTNKPIENSLDVLVAKCTPVTFDLTATHERWTKYLNRVQPDQEACECLQQIFGACLTGIQLEKCFIFFLGEGGNGKSVFMRMLQELLGPDYAFVCKKALIFQPHKGGGEQAAGANDIADLSGMRLITTAEQVGRRWNLEFIKDYTGGEKQHSRQLYKEGKNFVPTGKIVIPANDEPGMDEFTEAVRRRFALIEWPITLTEDEKIPFEPYIEELKKDLSGILNWALEGLEKLRKNNWRLMLPAAAEIATQEYLSEQDEIRAFLEAQFENTSTRDDPPKCCVISDMYRLFKENWLEEERYVISKSKFARRLQRHYGKKRVVRGAQNKMVVLFLAVRV